MAWVPQAMAAAPSPIVAGVLGIARTTGRPGAAASSAAIVTPAAIDSTKRRRTERRAGGIERLGHVGGLQAHDDHIGVGDGPGDAGHHPHGGETGLELPAPVGVDLGDREVVGLEVGFEEAARQRRAHLPAAEQRHTSHGAHGRIRMRSNVLTYVTPAASAPCRAG